MSRKMLPVWCEVVCNQCAYVAQGKFIRTSQHLSNYTKNVKASGWVWDESNSEWLCPRCKTKYNFE